VTSALKSTALRAGHAARPRSKIAITDAALLLWLSRTFVSRLACLAGPLGLVAQGSAGPGRSAVPGRFCGMVVWGIVAQLLIGAATITVCVPRRYPQR